MINKLEGILGLRNENNFAEIVDLVVHFDLEAVKPDDQTIHNIRINMADLSSEPNPIIILASWLSQLSEYNAAVAGLKLVEHKRTSSLQSAVKSVISAKKTVTIIEQHRRTKSSGSKVISSPSKVQSTPQKMRATTKTEFRQSLQNMSRMDKVNLYTKLVDDKVKDHRAMFAT